MSEQQSCSRKRKRESNKDVLEAILARLNTLEKRFTSPPPPSEPLLQTASTSSGQAPHPVLPALMIGAATDNVHDDDSTAGGAPVSLSRESITTGEDTTGRIVEAITSLVKIRSNNYYISNFDPYLHNIDDWCEEVDRAKETNGWDDIECLSRIGNFLKGEARVWLNEWSSTDRSWTNFKREFKMLCPRTVDIASILYEVMTKDSKCYPTYAEYARRSLLRLGLVKGLSDELIVAIVLRGIIDPHIKAAATNAKLQPNDLVQFLSMYIKPKNDFPSTRNISRGSRPSSGSIITRRNENKKGVSDVKCHSCGRFGHKRIDCMSAKRTRLGIISGSSPSNTQSLHSVTCSFCKKIGHEINECFAKQRSESTKLNPHNVNFCSKLDGSVSRSTIDVTSAVIEGVPIDLLVDSGSCISLVSSSLLKHLKVNRKSTYRILRGIGSQLIECSSFVTLIVELPHISIEADFYVVPHDCISTPVIIGTDILNREGITYIRQNGVQILTRTGIPIPVNHAFDINNVNTPLKGEGKEQLLLVISNFSKFFITGTASSTVTTGSMKIEVSNNEPVCYRPYKLSYDEKLRVRSIVKDLMAKGIIRESESPYASPVILVKKKDGTDRMCVDYRVLNSRTVKDKFPLPLIEDHIDRLGSSRYFTSLDMATGFHQVPMETGSIAKTAFVTPEGHFEYVKMPYGLSNAPVFYQKIISKTLKSFIDSGKVLVYIDDVLLLSDTIPEGLALLRRVLETLTSSGFSINLKKCTFLSSEIEYLGRVISNGQVRPSTRKVQALIDSPKPRNVKQIRQFLGLAGYFRRYIPNYAQRTTCIARLTKKHMPFEWGVEQDKAREYIINCLTNEPVLAIYDPQLPTEVHTDASAIGYGAVLIQIHEGGLRRAVAYFSKSTQGAEPKYHSYELETLAVVKALQNFRKYLLGIPFKIVTDCNALKLTERKKDLLPRVARWWLSMQDFQYTFEYRKGSLMSHADYLSRNPVEVCHIQKPKNWARLAQSADEETLNLIDKFNNGQLDSSRYVLRNGLLYVKYFPVGEEYRLLCYIPKGFRLSLLHVFHDDQDHIGYDKTVELILRHFWFPGLRPFVRKYLKHCIVCLSHKRIPRAPHQPIESWTKPDVPFSVVHMDTLGPLPESQGYKYVLIIIDAFTKYCLLYSLHRQDTDELKRAFTNAVSMFGSPRLLVTDRGRMFESAAFHDMVNSFGSDIHFITPNMHHENGQAERYCRTLLNLLRIEVNHRGRSWSDVLWKTQLILNSTKHSTTNMSPLQLLIGSDTSTPVIRALIRDVAIDIATPSREALMTLRRQRVSSLLSSCQQKQDAHVNKGRKSPNEFEVNGKVFVIKASQSAGKLDSCMRGPYKILKRLPHNRYKLELLAGSYGKRTEAAAENLVPWAGEWTPETCAAFFDSEFDDSLHDTSEEAEARSNLEHIQVADEDDRLSGEAVLHDDD